MTQPIDREHDPRWPVLNDYIRDIADRMGLQQWFLNLSHDAPIGEDTIASTFVCYHSIDGTLSFSDNFFVSSLEKQRLVVVHELLHLIEAPHAWVITEMKEFTPPALDKVQTLEHERAIDWMASLIAPRFPLIVWPEESPTV